MAALPFEVLLITFEKLDTKDLKQCQLVSKWWNRASLKPLYSFVVVNEEEQSRLYVRTIKSSPQLAKLLETIYVTEDMFEKGKGNMIWDKHSLLDTVINHSPNLLNIKHQASSSPFWTKLMYAASQGQLPRLQYVTEPWEQGDFDYYAYTALSFKNTLKTLNLPDFDSESPNLHDSKAYPILRNHLNQFPCLETLYISYKSQQPLSGYDSLIEDCQHLKILSILPSGFDVETQEIVLPEINPLSKINPRPNILELECKWEYIKDDNQLNYIMKKFPNLKSLSVCQECFGYEYFERASSEVLLKFLRFTTNIQKLDLDMILEEEECIKVWADIINEKYNNIELKIALLDPTIIDDPVVYVKFNKKYQLSLQFDSSEVFVSLYNKFLADSGENIQRLILKLFKVPPSLTRVNLNLVSNKKFCAFRLGRTHGLCPLKKVYKYDTKKKVYTYQL